VTLMPDLSQIRSDWTRSSRTKSFGFTLRRVAMVGPSPDNNGGSKEDGNDGNEVVVGATRR
jgi:hypothetical protein